MLTSDGPEGRAVCGRLLPPVHPAAVHVRGKTHQQLALESGRDAGNLSSERLGGRLIELLEGNGGLDGEHGVGAHSGSLVQELPEVGLFCVAERVAFGMLVWTLPQDGLSVMAAGAPCENPIG